ncbi:hypothetical protein CCP3SC1AL1_260002 [Gammaproteobacteria bacterium]
MHGRGGVVSFDSLPFYVVLAIMGLAEQILKVLVCPSSFQRKASTGEFSVA